jgi:cytosine/adenosine deaminase-related metal-dependent hydrolase
MLIKNLNRIGPARLSTLVVSGLLIFFPAPRAQSRNQTAPIASGKRYPRMVIRNATVIDGNGTPAAGPKDIVIEDNRIADVVAADPVALKSGRSKRAAGDVEIDATGKYVLPGLIDAHAHLQDERAGVAQPFDYELKLWLACGITTVRDVGSDTKKALELRRKSEAGEIASPRIFIYPMFGNTSLAPKTPEQARERVRQLHQMGVDGIKILDIDRDLMAAMEDEAHKFGLRIAHHAGVQETNAWDDIKFGTTSIEHWYGIPDAAIDAGVQNFPPAYDYNKEVDRFRYAGRL